MKVFQMLIAQCLNQGLDEVSNLNSTSNMHGYLEYVDAQPKFDIQ